MIVTLAACGTTSRPDFEAKMQKRGGGLTTTLAHDALAALSARYATDDLTFTDLTMDATKGDLIARVRDPRHPDRLDDLTFSDGHLGEPSPVQVSTQEDLNRMAFSVAHVAALGQVERIFDTALAKTHYPEGRVQSIEISRGDGTDDLPWDTTKRPPTPPQVSVSVTSPRAEAQVMFTADGRFEKVVRQ
jgi:hypothetical protein